MGLDRKHAKVLADNGFEYCKTLADALKLDEWDGCRVLYAISEPGKERIVYVGDTETGRNLRARLKSHLNDRSKIGLIEENSHLWVHFMTTEFSVLTDFEEATGGLPELNKRKYQK